MNMTEESRNDSNVDQQAAPADAPDTGAQNAEAAPQFQVVLASGSPRRAQLLQDAGVKFTVRTPASPVDETLDSDQLMDPVEAAKKLAEQKAGAVVQEILGDQAVGNFIVIGADTMVVKDGEIFGKPRSFDDGMRMLKALSGTTHEVVTAVSLWMLVAPNQEDGVACVPHAGRGDALRSNR